MMKINTRSNGLFFPRFLSSDNHKKMRKFMHDAMDIFPQSTPDRRINYAPVN